MSGETTVHGTAVAIGNKGVLLRGPPGAGKSDLALRLIDGGGRLIADDVVAVAPRGRGLDLRRPARTPRRLEGRIEVRGLGIAKVPSVARAPFALVVDLVEEAAVERLPEANAAEILGRAVPRLALAPFEASAAAKVRLAVKALDRDNAPRR
jgi:serine kinase of HPr protein (carbohydrate metabolism regulator)